MTVRQHPTVVKIKKRLGQVPQSPPVLEADWLRRTCLDLGADDVGFVEIGRQELSDERPFVEAALPGVQTLISFVIRTNPDAIRSPKRSVSNQEFQASDDEITAVGRRICESLSERGARAINTALGFPMELNDYPRRTWVVGHKTVAVAAGLGAMGIHRCIIHPRFGNFILLGTIVTDARVTAPTVPIDYNPCLECKLCVAACPVGAIKVDDDFDFSACYNHNYREFMTGFTSFTEELVEAKNKLDLRKRVSDRESISMWQSLSFGASYKAGYCVAACPAGEDVLGPFLRDRKEFLNQVVRPLQRKHETVYVVPGSDAESHVLRRFPHKTVQRVPSSLRADSADSFLETMPFVFQREPSRHREARYHFIFRGDEELEATVHLDHGVLQVSRCLVGKADVRIEADSATWVAFVAGNKKLWWALLTGRIRIRGRIKLMKLFARSFP
ncbi:MAG: 4Fe-4S binding protein [Myxococcales bacterium]|nr:4Fe-4S binding protein [Myxococcales bacterium]